MTMSTPKGQNLRYYFAIVCISIGDAATLIAKYRKRLWFSRPELARAMALQRRVS
jgi:hypothetical protein